MLTANKHLYKDRGFELFRQGTFGNGGQNLYVSRKGRIQRIHHYDYNGDGYIELPIANSHDDDTRVPVYVYGQPMQDGQQRLELATDGAYAAAVGDLNGDGYDDLVIANQYDGVSNEVYAQIYYGSPEGWGPQRMIKLWAPAAKDVEIGDFNGDGRPDLAFISRKQLRLFAQSERGFASGAYTDIELSYEPDMLAAADWDGDGYTDLAVRFTNRVIAIYWGGPNGLDAGCYTVLDGRLSGADEDGGGTIGAGVDQAASGAGGGTLEVLAVSSSWRMKKVALRGKPHLYVCVGERTLLIPFGPDRSAGEPIALDSGETLGAASGDIRGTGAADLVLAARQPGEDGKHISWIYWEMEGGGYSNAHRQAVATDYAIDVAAGDLDGDGCAEVVFCQDKTVDMYSHYCLIYRGSPDGLITDAPIRLESHCAMDALIARSSSAELPQVVLVNHLSNRILGNVPSFIYLGGPDGFQPERRIELVGWAATEIRACDFNDNGYVDLFVANSNENALHMDNGSFLYYGSESGYSEQNRIELPTVHTMSSCCADLNRDGYLDLIVGGFANEELLIFYGTEDGFTQEPQRIRLEKDGLVFKQPRFMTLADFNGDGWLDLAIPECGPSGKLILLWGGPDGFDMSRSTLLDSGSAISTRAADLNGDGWLDLIVGGYKGDDPGDPYRSFVYIYWGGPEGFSNDRRSQLPANFAADVSVADFNRDGVLDLFVSCYHGHRSRDIDSYLYWGEPGGVYTEQNRTILPHHSASGSLAADFNEDGYIDLAVANHKTFGNHPGQSYVWWNGPEGFSPERLTKLPSTGPHGITHADIGNIMDRSEEELYVSRAIELPWQSGVQGIGWSADVPVKTWVKAQLRAADSREALEHALWTGPDGDGSWFTAAKGEDGGDDGDGGDDALLPGPLPGVWVQYRLALGAVNSGSTPRVSEVRLLGPQI